ncbi:MAG: ABC transporter permease [Acidobacteriota bacterium]
MLRGLWPLVWLETKIFIREPLGLIGTVGTPVLVFVVMSRLIGPRMRTSAPNMPRFATVDLPVFAALLIAIGAVLSLVAIIAIYREGGILKRLRATPLRPYTILTAHVVVKGLMAVATLAAMILAGRDYPLPDAVPLVSFSFALLISTISILSVGFLIASLVPTARFAQPVGTVIFYPMLGLSGLFVPLDVMPPALRVVARLSPLTPATSLLRGIWHGEGWAPHLGDVAALVLVFVVFTAISTRIFRWE